MKPVMEYLDYRAFLKDFYEENKKKNRYFSYRYFSRKADIKSPNFLKAVIEGDRNLTQTTMEKFAVALGLDESDRIFFFALVKFNQAKTAVQKQERYGALRELLQGIQPKKIPRNLYDYFEHWYNPVIRELICMQNFKDDFKKLAATLHPKIRPLQAKKAVQLLQDIQMVKRQKDGSYIFSDPILTTGRELNSIAVRNFNQAMLQNAVITLENLPPEERHVSGITMSVSKNAYELITQTINQFKDTVLQIVHDDKHADEVYQLNVQLFPVSQRNKKIKS